MTAELSFDAQRGADREVWFEVPVEHAGAISDSGNAWLACLLALAAHRGESMRLCLPVDAQLLAGARELLRIWQCWYPEMHEVGVQADIAVHSAGDSCERTAAMFSGGVDSFFTAFDESPAECGDAPIRVDELITIPGFGVRDRAGVLDVRDSLRAAAARLEKALVVVFTNIGVDSSLGYPWELSHSGVLAAAALLLERRYARLLIPSTHGYAFLAPGGSHPLTDPLFSTARTRVIHHGSSFLRAAKLERIANRDAVQDALQVCTLRSDRNCGACPKCYCTMLHLDVLGLLSRYRNVFPVDAYDPAAVASIDSSGWDVHSYLEFVLRTAEERGRVVVAEAVRRGFHRTARRARWLRARRFAAAAVRNLFVRD